MGLKLVNLDTELTEIQCGTCGVWHAIPKVMYDSCVTEGGFWHCPNGHERGFSEGSNIAKIKRLNRQLEQANYRANAAQAEAEHNERRRRAEKGAKTRLKNRVGNGVCPCCNRTFANLQRHMANEHPDFSTDVSAEPVIR